MRRPTDPHCNAANPIAAPFPTQALIGRAGRLKTLLSPFQPWAVGRSTWAGGLGIAACLALMSGVSVLRAVLDGHLDPDNSNLPLAGYLCVVVPIALAQAVSAWLFLKAWSGAAQLSWRRLAIVAGLIHVCALLALPLSSNDIYSNLANGRLWQAGLSPYRYSPADLGTDDPFTKLVSWRWQKTTTPYGPVSTWMSRSAVGSGDLWRSIWMYKLEMGAVSALTLLLGLAFCRRMLDAEAGPRSFVFLAWNPLVAWELTAQAHNDAVMIAGCMAFVWAATAGRTWLAGLALCLAFYAKFAVAPVLGLYGVYVLRRSPLRALGLAALWIGSGVLLFAPFWEGPHTLDAPLAAAGSQPTHICNSLFSVASSLVQWIDPRWTWYAFLAWSWPCKIGFACLAARLAWRARSLDAVLSDSLLFLLFYESLAMGWFFPWYLGWLFPLAVARGDRDAQRIVGCYAALSPLVYIPDDGFLIGALLLHGIPLAMWLVDRRRRRQGEAAPVAPAAEVPALRAA